MPHISNIDMIRSRIVNRAQAGSRWLVELFAAGVVSGVARLSATMPVGARDCAAIFCATGADGVAMSLLILVGAAASFACA